jgi:predicted amidohydrolase
LSGAAEVPAVVTTATGSATLALSGGNINYTINVTGLSGPATLAHIHIAAAGVSGPVRVDLCGVAGSPACGAATTGVLVTGTATAANLHGATMEEVIQAMRDFTAYVNVHTAANSAGEIRGQILSEP